MCSLLKRNLYEDYSVPEVGRILTFCRGLVIVKERREEMEEEEEEEMEIIRK